MKLWIDKTNPAPKGYEWCKSINEAKKVILDTDEMNEIPRMYDMNFTIEIIDINNNTGDYNYIEFLKWLKETNHNYPIHTHSMNSVTHGKWTITEYPHHLDVECSICKKSYYVCKQGQYRIEQSAYCPNCGAKMDGGNK